MTTYLDQRPRARKCHACDLCGQPIEAGTVYVRQAQIAQGYGWQTYRSHLGCDAVAGWWARWHGSDGRGPDDLWEGLGELRLVGLWEATEELLGLDEVERERIAEMWRRRRT